MQNQINLTPITQFVQQVRSAELSQAKEVKMSLSKFFSEVFNLETMFTKSDLDLLTTLYKSLEKNMKVNLH